MTPLMTAWDAAPVTPALLPEAADWSAANQRYLRAALDRLAVQLAGEAAGGKQDTEMAWRQAAAALPAPAALETLCAAFGLSPFERDLVLLCAGVELDAAFGPLLAAAQGDPARPFATFSLALAVLPAAHWSALVPEAALRRWRLLEVGSGATLLTSPLHIEERVLHYLLGVNYLDDRLVGLIEHGRPTAMLSPSHTALAEQIVRLWRAPDPTAPLPVVQLCGNEGQDKEGLAALACRELGWEMYRLSVAGLPLDPRELEALLRLWNRESILSRAALLLDLDEADADDAARSHAVSRFVAAVAGPLIVTGRERRPWRGVTLVSLEVASPPVPERQALWRAALGAGGHSLNGHVDALAAQFSLDAAAIRAAAAELNAAPAAAAPGAAAADAAADALAQHLWDACRSHVRPRLDALAQRIEVRAAWDDLVLPPAQVRVLHELAGQVRRRVKVYEEWGFAAKSGRGLGISALFAGISGAGKTLAAEVLAGALRLDLYRIDLSQVVSKYIGETEKNLRRVFDAAEEGAAVLLFDEADALFGKRSEVKDSHDRYANIEVSYLLQRMELYRGLAILTTNMKDALDPAFLRRIRFVVSFPFPDAAQRAEIWRRVLPPALPTQGVDVARLARLNVAGGAIRNIALNAAFLAADGDQPLGMAHLLRAAQIEYAKLEKQLPAGEVGDWV